MLVGNTLMSRFHAGCEIELPLQYFFEKILHTYFTRQIFLQGSKCIPLVF